MTGRLAGAVIAATGGGSGIGRAAVDAFLEEGARVAVMEIDPSKVTEFDPQDERLMVIQGDATTADDNCRLVAAACERWDQIDTLVTFVGIFDHYTPLASLAPESVGEVFNEIFATNVLGPLLSARAALEALRRSRGSVIFTLSSSSFYPGRGGVLYVGSKFALRGVVRELAHELAPEVRVNGVAPGGTLSTDLRGARTLGLDQVRLADRPDRRASLEGRTPLHIALEPGDHAGAYVYLASRESYGVTGEILRVDGGLGAR
jgi:NAD(P)-dependent dehydrogenase (short-subunit alcohol dehydrogenase family)